MDDPANGGVSKGSCLLSKENSTFLSDYGPCSNLSSTVISIPCLRFFYFRRAYFPIIPESNDPERERATLIFVWWDFYAGWA